MLFVVLDVVASLLFAVVWTVLCCMKILPLTYLAWFGIGMAIASLWEITHALVPNFITFKREPDRVWAIFSVLAHIIWDSLILIVSALIAKALRLNLKKICALLLMIAFCFGQEIIVELLFNGLVWIYNPNLKANPVMFRIGKSNTLCGLF